VGLNCASSVIGILRLLARANRRDNACVICRNHRFASAIAVDDMLAFQRMSAVGPATGKNRQPMSSDEPRAIPPPRKIPLASIGVSMVMCMMAAMPAYRVYRYFAPGHFVVGGVLAVAVFTILLLAFCRAFLRLYPLPIGEIVPNSQGEVS
jgi:hypothetical protein